MTVELRWVERTSRTATGAKYTMPDGSVLDGMFTETKIVLQYREGRYDFDAVANKVWIGDDWRDVPVEREE